MAVNKLNWIPGKKLSVTNMDQDDDNTFEHVHSVAEGSEGILLPKQITLTPDVIDALTINQNNNKSSIVIDSKATSDKVLDLKCVNTSGDAVFIHNTGEQTAGIFVYIKQDHAGSTAPAFVVYNDGTGNGVNIDQNGNGNALVIDNSGSENDIVAPNFTLKNGTVLTAVSGVGFPDLLFDNNFQDPGGDHGVEDQRIRKGWHYIQGDDSARINKAMSFNFTFDDIPIIVATGLGSSGTVPDSLDDFGVSGSYWNVCVTGISTTGFHIYMLFPDDFGNPHVFDSSFYYGFTWIAIGTKAR